MAESRMFDGSDWITVTDEEHRTASDPHPQYHTDMRGDARYSALGHGHTLDAVTDTATRVAMTPAERTKLGQQSGTNTGDQVLPTWGTISGKPVVVAAGATQADARTAIGAGTSNLAIGTTGTTAAAGNRQATDTTIGMVELATTAEATTGTDTQRAVTPAGVKAVADTKAPASHTHDDRYYTETEADARYLQTATAQPINAQTGTAYTLQASDAGKLVTLTNAAAITLTVPGSVFTAGQRVDCLVLGAGMVTAVGSSCTVSPPPGRTLVTQGTYSAFTLFFTSATTAVVIGDMAAA